MGGGGEGEQRWRHLPCPRAAKHKLVQTAFHGQKTHLHPSVCLRDGAEGREEGKVGVGPEGLSHDNGDGGGGGVVLQTVQ